MHLGFTLLCIALSFGLASSAYSIPFLEASQDDQFQDSRYQRAAPASNWYQQRWPNATVYYVIDEHLFGIQDEILRAMRQIESLTCVRYVPRNNETDYVFFIQNTTTCREPVGRQGREQRVLIKESECGVYGFYLHALMQTLGFYHEHQRWDRDEHITIYPENIDDEWKWAFDRLNETSHIYNTTYDVDSIMHYGSYQFSMNNQPAIRTKKGEVILSWTEKAKLSPLDVVAINDYYQCPNSSSSNCFKCGANLLLQFAVYLYCMVYY